MTHTQESYLQKYLNNTQTKTNSAVIAYLASLDYLEETNPEIAQSIIKELADQRSNLKLIASENFSSLAVQLSMGNLLTDKYAEGYPRHRFYAGCDNVDDVEEAAQNELKKIFGAECAFVQPHSGADANMVAFWAILVHKIQNKEVERLGRKNIDELTPEEYEVIRQKMMNQKMMGLSLNSGGHLTHGYKHNLSAKMMKSIPYDVDPKTEMIDYEELRKQVERERPLILLAGYSAYPCKINFAKMKEIADSVGAVLMADIAHFAGLVAGKVFTGEYDPVPYADIVTSTTHKTLRGPRGGFVLCTKEYEEVINKACPLVLGGPLPHVLASKAIAFKEVNTEAFRDYAHRIVENSQSLAAALKKKGVRITTGGTENHLLIIDLTQFGLTGRIAETILRSAGLTVNRNAIPFDKNGPWYTSGVRIGTPAVTTLGMGKEEMDQIAEIIFNLLSHTTPAIVKGVPSKAQGVIDQDVLNAARNQVQSILRDYPLYPELII